MSIHLEHQRAAREFRLTISTLGRELEETTARIDEINETIANETEGDAPRRARMLRAVSLASRAQIAANLTGGLKNVFGIERQSHNMDANSDAIRPPIPI